MSYIVRHSVTASSWLAVRSQAADENVFDESDISKLGPSLLTFIEWIILNIYAITSVYVLVTNLRQMHLASSHPKGQDCQFISIVKPTWCNFYCLLKIKSLYLFRALLAHLQEALHKRRLVYCVRVMSFGFTGTRVPLQTWCSQLT
jgi:hypothetical protein